MLSYGIQTSMSLRVLCVLHRCVRVSTTHSTVRLCQRAPCCWTAVWRPHPLLRRCMTRCTHWQESESTHCARYVPLYLLACHAHGHSLQRSFYVSLYGLCGQCGPMVHPCCACFSLLVCAGMTSQDQRPAHSPGPSPASNAH